MKIFPSLIAIAFTSLGTITALQSQAAMAAERISFALPLLGEFYLSIEDLESFAATGAIAPELAYYVGGLDEGTLTKLRQILQTSLTNEPEAVYRLTNLSMGEDFLKRLGNLVYTHPQRNGLHAIRSALILAAAEPEGLTPIEFLRHFPTREIQLNTDSILSVIEETENLFQYKEAVIKAIAKEAKTEIAARPSANFENLPDLRQTGKYSVSQQTMTFATANSRQTAVGLEAYNLETDFYLPQGLKQAAPLAIIAHGLGSQRSDFAYLARHLASHGYIVAVPQHSGSKEREREGKLNLDVSPWEFYSRPRDLTQLLDKLERTAVAAKIDRSQIGVLGHSFGGTAALLAGGAPLNLARIAAVCDRDRFTLNVSLFLQCRASKLQPGNYDVRDSRIKAIVALNPVTSSILGLESLQKIAVPTLIVGGTQDFISPFISEQVHPFLWLTTSNKYLATMVNGGHFSTLNEANIAGINDFFVGSRPDLGRDYLKVLSLAFFEAHVRDRLEYRAYLTAAYAEHISNSDLPLLLVRSLTAAQLESAYGSTPPKPPIPPPLENTPQKPERRLRF